MLYKTGRADGSLINDGENMNLELDLQPKLINNNLMHFSKPPFELKTDINGNLTATLYAAGGRYENLYDVALLPLNDIFNHISAVDFASETALAPITDFNEELMVFNNRIIKHLIDDDYQFAVTKKFNWKRGMYDKIKEAIDNIEKRKMKPSGMNSIFKRIDDNRWNFNNLKSRALSLDAKRIKAKSISGELIDNIDTLVENQANIMNDIDNNTIECNKISKNTHVYNFVNLPNDSYYSIELYTLVVIDPNFMNIMRGTSIIGQLPTPKVYMYFKRPLYKVLVNSARNRIVYKASCPGAKHPYIDNIMFYTRSDFSMSERALGSGGIQNPWGTLCLSSFTDDIVPPLERNDYESFVMGLCNWNNVYDIENTHPYRYPKDIYSLTGFGDEPILDENNGLLSWTGFRKSECFQTNTYVHILAENDNLQVDINNSITKNITPYAAYIVDSCNIKKCPLRDKCDNYQYVSHWVNNEDMWYIAESIVGYLYSDYDSIALAIYYHQHCTRYMNYNEENYYSRMYDMLSDSLYWETQDNTEEDNVELSIEQKVESWRHAMQREERRSLHER